MSRAKKQVKKTRPKQKALRLASLSRSGRTRPHAKLAAGRPKLRKVKILITVNILKMNGLLLVV